MPIGWRGQIYSSTDTATHDSVRRFVTSELKLTRCIIQVRGYDQYFGHGTVYPVYYNAGEHFELMDVDISSLYFANKTAGQNGTVAIVGVYAD